MYACILNAQGRYLHDLFFHRIPGTEGPAVLVDTDKKGLPDLLRLLKRYKLRAKVDVSDVSDEFRVWAAYGQSCALPAELPWERDARLSLLGARAVAPADAPPSVAGCDRAEEGAYQRWRVEHGVAEGDSEIPTGEAIALEYNIEALHGISFDKGCYVGQELMARTHFKGVVRKRLMPVRLAARGGNGGTAPAPGDDVVQEGSGKSVGKLRVTCGDVGLAHVRLQAALAAAEGRGPGLLVRGGSAGVTPWRPSWWPEHWGREDEEKQTKQSSND